MHHNRARLDYLVAKPFIQAERPGVLAEHFYAAGGSPGHQRRPGNSEAVISSGRSNFNVGHGCACSCYFIASGSAGLLRLNQ